jgi:sugar lactone lactonase YvrE
MTETHGSPDAGRRRWSRPVAPRRRQGRALRPLAALLLAGLAAACGGETNLTCPGGAQAFAPTGVAFGATGELYVTDSVNGAVFRLDGERCATIAEGWARPYGVAALDDGRVCVSHYTSHDPLTREAAVSCWDGTGWTLAVQGLGSGVNGLAAAPDGLWLAVWEDTPVESRNGVLLFVEANRVTREVRLDGEVPRFLAPRPDGGLLVTVVREDASGITSGAVLTLSPDGRLDRLEPVLERPAGIAWSDQGVWVADDRPGDLILLTPDGRRSIHPRQLQGASGLALNADGDVCVAETDRSRITCIPSDSMLGKGTADEE